MLRKKKKFIDTPIIKDTSNSNAVFFVVFNYDGSHDFSVHVASTREDATKFINCDGMKYSSVLGTFEGKFFRDVCDLTDNRDSNEPVNCQAHNISQQYVGERR